MTISSDKVAVGKNTVFTLILIILALAVAVGIALTRSNGNQTSNVRIVQSSRLAAEDQHNGYMYWPFKVSLSNRGGNNVSGLTLIVRFLSDDVELGRATEYLNTLGPSHELTVTMGIYLGYYVPMGKTTYYVVQLRLGEKVLDESGKMYIAHHPTPQG